MFSFVNLLEAPAFYSRSTTTFCSGGSHISLVEQWLNSIQVDPVDLFV
jgi:hypothetical protein